MKRTLQLSAVVVLVLSSRSANAIVPHQPTYCGDPCSTTGAGGTCIDTSHPDIRKVECTCLSGHWVC